MVWFADSVFGSCDLKATRSHGLGHNPRRGVEQFGTAFVGPPRILRGRCRAHNYMSYVHPINGRLLKKGPPEELSSIRGCDVV